jgi:hypothetical protein
MSMRFSAHQPLTRRKIVRRAATALELWLLRVERHRFLNWSSGKASEDRPAVLDATLPYPDGDRRTITRSPHGSCPGSAFPTGPPPTKSTQRAAYNSSSGTAVSIVTYAFTFAPG